MSRPSVARAIGLVIGLGAAAVVGGARADDLPTFAGPAMGTTYRVTLARGIPGVPTGAVHRETERVLAEIDRAASTWRDDSDASRFNRAAAGAWVTVAADLVSLVEIAREVHAGSRGAFDITAAPLVALRSRQGAGGPDPRPEPEPEAVASARRLVGMSLVELRPVSAAAGPALRKVRDGVAIDLGGIAPGYAVDRIGSRLVELGSQAHLVELGGEVRAWGRRPDGGPWRVRLRGAGSAVGVAIALADGAAVATSTVRPGRSPVDPRSGRLVAGPPVSVTVRAGSCAVADAWAVAALVLGLAPGPDGTLAAPPLSPAADRGRAGGSSAAPSSGSPGASRSTARGASPS